MKFHRSILAPWVPHPLQDREVTLYDGVRFISAWRWQHLQGAASMAMAELRRRGTRMTHPSFRMVALATPARAWLGSRGVGSTGEWHLDLEPWDPGDLGLRDF